MDLNNDGRGLAGRHPVHVDMEIHRAGGGSAGERSADARRYSGIRRGVGIADERHVGIDNVVGLDWLDGTPAFNIRPGWGSLRLRGSLGEDGGARGPYRNDKAHNNKCHRVWFRHRCPSHLECATIVKAEREHAKLRRSASMPNWK